MTRKIQYDNLVSEIIHLKNQLTEARSIFNKAQSEMRWYLSDLVKTVADDDIDNFKNYLKIESKNDDCEKNIKTSNSFSNDEESNYAAEPKLKKDEARLRWVKDLYRTAVKRCHPDRLGTINDDHKSELIDIYRSIVKSYEDGHNGDLMINSSKVFVRPKKIDKEKVQILVLYNQHIKKQLNEIIKSDAFQWANMEQKVRETYVVNYLKQMGIKFVDINTVQSVLKRTYIKRKPGQRPSNNLKNRNVKK